MQTVTITQLEKTQSTNTYLKQLLQQGHKPPHGTVVWAKQQTAGRGKGMRSWIADHNSICFSLLLTNTKTPSKSSIDSANSHFDESTVETAAVVTQLAAVAVCDAMSQLGIDCRIKWPNDVLVDKHKLCGILVDSGAYPSAADSALENAKLHKYKSGDAYVVGIGINAYHHAHELQALYQTISTASHREGAALPPTSIFHQLQKHSRHTATQNAEIGNNLQQKIDAKKLIEIIGNTLLDYFESYRNATTSCRETVSSEKMGEVEQTHWTKKWFSHCLLTEGLYRTEKLYSKKIADKSRRLKVIGISPSGKLLLEQVPLGATKNSVDQHNRAKNQSPILTMPLIEFNRLL